VVLLPIEFELQGGVAVHGRAAMVNLDGPIGRGLRVIPCP